MMNVAQISLAAGNFEGFEILAVLAFVVISVISGLVQKSNKAKAELEEQAARRKRQQAGAQSAQADGAEARPAAGTAQGLQVLQPRPSRQVARQGRPKLQPARPPAVRKSPGSGLKPKKTSIESRHTGSAHVGSADVGRLAHANIGAEQITRHMIRVDLTGADAVKRAMILHEIFSPPKALRREKELWDS